MSYNKVILLGNLTRDPEVRVLPKGTSVCQFGIAVNRKFKDEAGNAKEEVTFVDIEAWAKTADIIAKYFTKGKPILLEGRLKLEQWEDKATNQKRQKLKVVLESFSFVGGKDDAAPVGESASDSAPAPRRPESNEAATDDVPF